MLRNTPTTTRRWRRRAGGAVVASVLATLFLATVGSARVDVTGRARALAAADPAGVSFTLEGCRNDGTITLPIAGRFVCPSSAYTTGNLGKGWNELDLVPFRITASAGNSAPATQTYSVAVALDNSDAGHPGYDVLGSDGAGGAPVLNTSLSDAACTALSSTPQTTLSPGVGGIDQSIYRILTITQPRNTTCVYDWYGRLALGSHLFPGSSLHANLLNQNLGTAGIGSKDVSIPVKEIAPQQLSKDMTATQGSDHVWNITKSPSPASVSFANTCDPSAARSAPVSITVSWTKKPATPSGSITVVTHVYATNPAARVVTLNLTDNIRSGTTVLDTASAGPTDIPPNTANFLVLTHQTTVPAGTTNLNDVATGTYTDKATGVPIPGTTTATASAAVQLSGPELNQNATINDVESISGAGFQYSADSFSGASGAFDGGYVAGTHTNGSVSWTSAVQSGDGSVTFAKTIYVNSGTSSTGALSDTATLTGSDGFTAQANASVDISADARVALTIHKTIPDVLQTGESQTFTFHVFNSSNVEVATPTITFNAHDTSKSITVGNLAPDSYTVTEDTAPKWLPQDPQTANLTLPTCAGSVTFDNHFNVAGARAVKVSHPDGFKAGWQMILTGPGTPAGGEKVVTDTNGNAPFNTALQEGSYTITETPQAGWTGSSSGDCSFTVNYPADSGRTFVCQFDNTYQPTVKLTKTGDTLSKIGDLAHYTIKLDNTSPAPGPAGAPSLVCDISDATIGFSKTVTLAPGGSDTSNPTFTVPAGASDPFPNTATASCHYAGMADVVASSQSSWSVNLFQPSITVTKSAANGFSKLGDTVTYTVTITDTSSSDSPDLVFDSFSDTKVSAVTPPASCNTLSANAASANHSCTFSYTYVVQAGDADPLVNTATAHYHPTGFTNDIKNSGSATVDLLHPSFTVTKTCTTNPVNQGGTASFTITYKNTGDADLVFTPDAGDEGGTVSVAAGGTQSVTVTRPVPSGATSVANTVTGKATLAAKYGLSNSYAYSASDSCTVRGKVTVVKTVGGAPPAGGQTFTFELRKGASTASDGTVLETKNTDASGNISFATQLDPGVTYQLCEWVFPGWNTNLAGDGPLFVPNSMISPTLPNPDVNNLIVCVNFTVTAGQVRTFNVDNTPPPGGRALTIGFWKNWASCSKSNGKQKSMLDLALAIASQQTTNPPGGLVVSAQNFGSGWPNYAAAWYLVLKGDPTSTKDNINPAPGCTTAVNLLNKSTIDGAKKKASDPLFNMTAQLVAAQLNRFIGAGVGGATITNIDKAVLLDGKYSFNGLTYSPALTSADASLANCLATQLDNYNNNRVTSAC